MPLRSANPAAYHAAPPADPSLRSHHLRLHPAGLDGITALKQAQAIQPDVPVILISGTVGEEAHLTNTEN